MITNNPFLCHCHFVTTNAKAFFKPYKRAKESVFLDYALIEEDCLKSELQERLIVDYFLSLTVSP